MRTEPFNLRAPGAYFFHGRTMNRTLLMALAVLLLAPGLAPAAKCVEHTTDDDPANDCPNEATYPDNRCEEHTTEKDGALPRCDLCGWLLDSGTGKCNNTGCANYEPGGTPPEGGDPDGGGPAGPPALPGAGADTRAVDAIEGGQGPEDAVSGSGADPDTLREFEAGNTPDPRTPDVFLGCENASNGTAYRVTNVAPDFAVPLPDAAIRVMVLAADGEPAKNVEVVVTSSAGESRSARTNAQGKVRFVFANPGAGTRWHTALSEDSGARVEQMTASYGVTFRHK